VSGLGPCLGVSVWWALGAGAAVALPSAVLALGLASGAGPWRARVTRRWLAFLTAGADQDITRARRARQSRLDQVLAARQAARRRDHRAR
jgi:hypothetical protein